MSTPAEVSGNEAVKVEFISVELSGNETVLSSGMHELIHVSEKRTRKQCSEIC